MQKIGVVICFVIMFCSCSLKQKSTQNQQPNLLIIQTDEHNFRTLGCYRELLGEEQAHPWGKGVAVETPNLDRIAKEGAICTNYYASSPVCTPSRASFQTGLYPVVAGAPINGMSMFRNVKTFANVLKQASYSTSYVGKWHLYGHRPEGVSVEEHEYDYGYSDYAWRFETGHAKWVEPDYETKNFKLNFKEPKMKQDSLYVTDFLTNRALEVLERDKSKPFCLMLSLPNPHSPDIVREPYRSKYANLEAQAPASMNSELVANRPKWGIGGKSESGEFKVRSVQEYFGMVKCIDDNVGRILKFLDDNKLADNTIVIFTSDHGDLLFEHHRINKDQPYEASAKIPFLIRYPKKIKAGKIITDCYTTCDFPPTILGIMKQKQIEGVHGIDAAETFLNEESKTGSDRIIYISDSPFNQWTAATDGRYKLVLSCMDTPWLFDLKEDPNELHNYYSDPDYKEIADRLQKYLIQDMKKYKDPAIDLGLKYCYNADDEITYRGPYYQKTPKEIRLIENEVLENQINQIHEKCYKSGK